MSHEVYYHFPQTDGQARRAGARGGKTTARHRRERLDGSAAEEAEPEATATHGATTGPPCVACQSRATVRTPSVARLTTSAITALG